MKHNPHHALAPILLGCILIQAAGSSAQNRDETDPGPKPASQTEPRATAQDRTEIVVTAIRSEMLRFDAHRSTEQVNRRKLEEMQARSLPEAIDETDGVHLQQTNRGAGAPIIRGFIGPQNLILIDGIRFNTSTFRTGPNQYLATFDPHAVRQMEIVRGPSSVLYGSGAMGGVVNLLTTEPRIDAEPYGWNGLLSMGFSTADRSPGVTAQLASKSGASKSGRLSLLGGGSYTRFGELRAGDGEDQPHSDYDAGSWRAKAVYSPNRCLTVTGAYFGTRVDRAGRTDQAGQGDIRFHDNLDHFTYLSLRWNRKQTLSHLRITGTYHRLDEHVDRYGCPTNPDTGAAADLDGCLSLKDRFLNRKRRYDDRVDVLGADLEIGLDLLSHRLRLVGGAEIYWDSVDSRAEDARLDQDGAFPYVPSARGNFSDGSEYKTGGTYLHGDVTAWEISPAWGEIHVFAGGRFSYFAAFAPDVPGIGDVEYSFNGFAFAGGVQWIRSDLFNLYGTFTQGIRAPNLQETTVLGDTGSKFEIPNDELEPERSDTIEAGAKLKLAPVEIGAAYFYSMLNEAIDEAPALHNGQSSIDGKPVIKRVNAQEGLYQGVEGSARVRLWRMTLRAGAAWIRGEITDAAGQTYPARRVPPLFGLAALRYEHPKARFFAEIFTRMAARQDRLHPSDEQDLRICETSTHSGVLDPGCNGTPGWYTLNLRGGAKLVGPLRVNLALLNLTDQKYKTHGSGLYAPGFDARITLSAEF